MRWLCGWFLVFISSLAADDVKQTDVTDSPLKNYIAKDFSYLKGRSGFSDALLDMHFTLYKGYVKNVNLLIEEIANLQQTGKSREIQFGALKRRLGWEYDGMRLHELYFSNLGGKAELKSSAQLYLELQGQYGSFAAWKDDFISTGMMRGIGWVILYKDGETGRFVNAWINEHDLGHLAGSKILLVMDVWEHAFITQYGLDREKYIQTFFSQIDWSVVEKRFSSW